MAKAAYWAFTDAEARKRGEQTGLDTLVVHAVNEELTGARTSSGVCGLIRSNAKNLTRS